MEGFKNKRISFLTILFSLLMIFFGIISKVYDGTSYNQRIYKEPSLKLFEVNVFGISFDYLNFLLFFIITLGIGIYLFIYKNDIAIKENDLLKNIKNNYLKFKNKNIDFKENDLLKNIKNKYLKLENKNIDFKKHSKIEQIENKDKILSIIQVVTFFSLFFTFFLSVKNGSSFYFFIILSYHHYITLEPKTKKELLIKSIGYPFIFLIILMFIESGSIYDSYRNTQGFFKHFFQFVTGSVIMYFTIKKRFHKPLIFNIKNPLFWISILCLILSIFKFIVEKQIENTLR